jgi:hypothetical protein
MREPDDDRDAYEPRIVQRERGVRLEVSGALEPQPGKYEPADDEAKDRPADRRGDRPVGGDSGAMHR